MDRNALLNGLSKLVQVYLILNSVFILLFWVSQLSETAGYIYSWILKHGHFLLKWCLLLPVDGMKGWNAVLFSFVFLFFKSGRNLMIFVLKNLFRFLKALPGKQTQSLLNRYMLLARYTLYANQNNIFNRLEKQYVPGSRFVVLPMDMEFMDAGVPPVSYEDQMAKLAEAKQKNPETLIPFVFVDPRRIEKEGAKYFGYTVSNGKVVLDPDCFIRDYIEKKEFGGFKIYPALGYYPFDEALLPVWKYAADNELPITTHCIKGTIFYRGVKHKKWDEHPIFKQAQGDNESIQLPLLERKNVDFSLNFTHPLNYLCLLEEPLLRILVSRAKDVKIKKLFGYTDLDSPLKHDLSHLKICLAHFGGEDQWEAYLERDRFNYPLQIIQHRDRGLDFSIKDGIIPWGRFEQHWKYVDWYSIIYSLMAQYDNVYADISYILSKPSIFPLLKETVNVQLNPKVSKKVLFGTDFYVVRNHNSDKELVANSISELSDDEFNLIARENTHRFVENKLH